MFAPATPNPAWAARLRRDYSDAAAFVVEGEDAASMAPLSASAHLRLTNMPLPMSIMIGERDLIVRHTQQGLALSCLVEASVQRLRDAGHMLHHTHTSDVLQHLAMFTAAHAR